MTHPATDTADLVQTLRTACPAARRLTADSRRADPESLFLAFPGQVHDGRHYIPAALAAGAAGVLWEAEGFDWSPDWPGFNLALPGLREAAAGLAAAWYGEPSRRLDMIGITGTNGKTSISHWLAQVLTEADRPTASIGTLGNGLPGSLAPTGHTTPDAVSLQGLLAEYRDAGIRGVAMEVSSHALDQGRVAGTTFDVAVLTNLSRDHLDYHGDMESYAQAKARLFGWPGLKWAVLNCDDDFGRALRGKLKGTDVRVLSYGLHPGDKREIDIHGRDLRLNAQGMTLTVATPWGSRTLHSSLLGEFNAYNLLAALAALLAGGMELDAAVSGLERVRAVPGRMQALESVAGAPTVVIDYAHTPDALEQTLKALRPLTAGRLLCVFGAGGGRDKGKRPLMGAAAAALADRCIVTSDNPRNEDPAHILADILAGMPPGQTSLVDRAEAIRLAVREAAADDVVLIAGKGHEDYQEINGMRLPFSDPAVAQAALRARGATA
ncbi:MAG TPA: UDP-N-acetylmuramoyl-L-alanyl-D-glutamate--2,6-diaminopimelate ligase [Thiobacillaceae bacterium]|nr:UDP-N-acetylmuramoyl-L-alanyl-D-glutamate--2,6-diaminopimelate ligase [Thiobacillaceae bacterium]